MNELYEGVPLTVFFFNADRGWKNASSTILDLSESNVNMQSLKKVKVTRKWDP